MAKFLILARDTGVRRDMSPESMQAVIQRYRAWTENLQKAGRLSLANKLKDNEGRVLKRQGGKLAVTDGPFTESKEIVGGFWVVDAKTYDEVLEFTRDHPHLEVGTLEIRQFHDFPAK
ncbi:MAG TPA: YciI family protein [Stellaceae bacterium]|nr:YciI family protein [Stellaceae bacterium]